jgi:hypothetical protein
VFDTSNYGAANSAIEADGEHNAWVMFGHISPEFMSQDLTHATYEMRYINFSDGIDDDDFGSHLLLVALTSLLFAL